MWKVHLQNVLEEQTLEHLETVTLQLPDNTSIEQ